MMPSIHPVSLTLRVWLDWIQDANLERSRRLRDRRKVNIQRRGPRGEVTLPWFMAQVKKVADSVASWFVVSLVGEFLRPPQLFKCLNFFTRLYHRRRHWGQRGNHIYYE